ncbi:hypothetical protein [Rhodococcus ruber]|uniref:hypothetical protein n=1 Tax=Rhodococcus ruber TaxID=1830 RepID=UPI000F52EB29|nr:hypothetical protein [Rhodococcus ruber]
MSHELNGLSRHEQAAAVAIAAVLGAQARSYDVDGRQGVVDVELMYPGGSTAALEITSHAGEGIRQRDSLLAASDHQWEAPGSWTWDIRVASPRIIPELQERYQRIILLLEQRGMTDTRLLRPWSVRDLPDDLQWVARSGVSFWSLSEDPAREHVVYLHPEGTGGVVDRQLTGLAEAISDILAADNQQSRIEKLLRSPHGDKHLFIALHEGALPFAQAVGLMRPEVELPVCAPPTLPVGITHLWFISTFSHTLVEVHGGRWHFHKIDGADPGPGG